ncbi:hypothetical protein, conserved, partial [Plasmodium malariae]
IDDNNNNNNNNNGDNNNNGNNNNNNNGDNNNNSNHPYEDVNCDGSTNKVYTFRRKDNSENCHIQINDINEIDDKKRRRKKTKMDPLFLKRSKNLKDSLLSNAKDTSLSSYLLAQEETNNLHKLDSYVDTLNNNSDVTSLAKQTILLLLKDILNCIPFQMAPSVISRKIYDQKINAHVKFVYQSKSLMDLMPYFFIFKNVIKQKTLPSDQSLYICNVLLYALFEA